MNHKPLLDECEALGLKVVRVPDTGAEAYNATTSGVCVYWRKSSTSDGLLGLPRVVVNGVDTHARSVKEVRYLVRRSAL
jgi:hypothetical protein